MSRGEANEVEGWIPSRGVQIPWKTFQKDLEKPLDKLSKAWYNKSVKRGAAVRLCRNQWRQWKNRNCPNGS